MIAHSSWQVHRLLLVHQHFAVHKHVKTILALCHVRLGQELVGFLRLKRLAANTHAVCHHAAVSGFCRVECKADSRHLQRIFAWIRVK